jgi:hypothetical protein
MRNLARVDKYTDELARETILLIKTNSFKIGGGSRV